MSSLLFAIIGIFLIVVFLLVLLFTPHERKDLSPQNAADIDDNKKDWKAASLKLEKHIQALRQKNAELEKKGRDLERELEIQKEKNQQLQEKLKLQKGWQEKEENEFEKHKKEIVHLRDVIHQTENHLNQEHADRLRFERRNREVEQELAGVQEKNRSLETQLAQLRAQGDGYRQQIQELRAENAKLAKQHDDTVWVAKSEHENLQAQYKEREKELVKLREQLRREIG